MAPNAPDESQSQPGSPVPPPLPSYAHAPHPAAPTTPPPSQPSPAGSYSADGRWFWNGLQWVPVSLPQSGKNKTTAGILAILLGDFGAHKFYLGNPGLGVLYLVFCWTFIPGIIGIVEGIIYLTSSDQDFALKYGGGLGVVPGPPGWVPPQPPL